MRSILKKQFYGLALLMFLGLPTNAQMWKIFPICIDYPIPVIPPIRIPVGCEVIDCCPGCPGPLIDWRIKVSGEVKGINFKIENMAAPEIKKLTTEGINFSSDGKVFNISSTASRISGFERNSKNRPPVIVPVIEMDKEVVSRMLSARENAKDSKADLGTTEVIIEQMLGDYVVNQVNIRFIWRRCFWPTKPPVGLNDKIVLLSNTSNDNAVVLLDGNRSTGCVDDEVNRGNGTINVGNVLSNGTCNSDVVVLSDDNAMELLSPATVWTNALGNVLNVNMRPMLQVPVTFWVMNGNFAATQTRVNNDVVRANQLYNSMNCGISFQVTAINDATANANTAALINSNCGQSANLRTQIGFTAGQLNVYYLGNPGARGWWCGGNTIIVGAGADNESLAHELGHAFSLGHTNGIAGISGTNLMITGGVGRNNITDGQCFRCNVNTGSTLNSNGIRTGITRGCPDGTTSTTCPSLALNNTPK